MTVPLVGSQSGSFLTADGGTSARSGVSWREFLRLFSPAPAVDGVVPALAEPLLAGKGDILRLRVDGVFPFCFLTSPIIQSSTERRNLAPFFFLWLKLWLLIKVSCCKLIDRKHPLRNLLHSSIHCCNQLAATRYVFSDSFNARDIPIALSYRRVVHQSCPTCRKSPDSNICECQTL